MKTWEQYLKLPCTDRELEKCRKGETEKKGNKEVDWRCICCYERFSLKEFSWIEEA